MTFARITILAAFVAVGLGIALCVAFSIDPPPADNSGEGGLPEAVTSRSGLKIPTGPIRAESQPEVTAPSEAEVVIARTPREPVPTAPVRPAGPVVPTTWPMAAAPVFVQPYPAYAAGVHGGKPSSGLGKLFGVLADRIAAAQPPRAGGASSGPEEVPPPPAESRFSPPPAPNLSAPPGDSVPGGFEGEGDGNLVMNFRDDDIREVLEALSKAGGLNILAGTSVQGKVSASLSGVDIDSALDAILRSTGYIARREGKFIYVGTPDELETMEQSLDRVGTRVYRPNYVTAAELQALITPLVSQKVGVVSVSSAADAGIGPDGENAGGDAFAGGEVVLVRDYEAILHQIDQVVAEIDVRPMQVAIEAMILSVKLEDGYEFGVNFEMFRDKEHVKLGWNEVPSHPLDGPNISLNDEIDVASVIGGATNTLLNGGLKFGFLDGSLGAFLNALETIGDTSVIATPRLMVLNKQRAEILIGEQLGYVSTTITETSSSQTVEFLDVGAQLRLRPYISGDGLIRMEVHPELSTGSVNTESGFTLPNKETTQVTTNIMVRDGCTVIIGGLMREELETSTTQVPLLGNLPWLGVAFRSKEETLQRREIIVLITPRIVYEPDTCIEGDEAACEFHRRQAVYAEKMSPIGKRSVARKFFRKAQSAWAEGDQARALKYAELAVHFDPLNRAAIDLRACIWNGEPYGEHTLLGPAEGPPTAALDGEEIDGWLLDELEAEVVPTPAPQHPLDRGTPGPHTDIARPRRLQ